VRTRLVILVFVTLVGITALAHAQDTAPPQTLFTNIKIFNGTDDRLIDANVLVEGSLIKEVGKNLRARKDATVIDGGGKTLMPGLISIPTNVFFRRLCW